MTQHFARAGLLAALPLAIVAAAGPVSVVSAPAVAQSPAGARDSGAPAALTGNALSPRCLVPVHVLPPSAQAPIAVPRAEEADVSPGNPCAPMPAVRIPPREADAIYSCLDAERKAAYRAASFPAAKAYDGWKRFSLHPYPSQTHGGRHVQNYANEVAAETYRRYEDVIGMPVGSVLAKDSFVPHANGRVSLGPLYVMEKMAAGFAPEGGDWRYTMIMPDGTIYGRTGGVRSGAVEFCAECHEAVAEQDHLYFIPKDSRIPGY